PCGEREGVAHQSETEHPGAGLAEAEGEGREYEDQQRIDLEIEARAEVRCEALTAGEPAVDAVERKQHGGASARDPARAALQELRLEQEGREERGSGGARQSDRVRGAEPGVRVPAANPCACDRGNEGEDCEAGDERGGRSEG